MTATFASDIEQARTAEIVYQKTGNQQSLNQAIVIWERILKHPDFSHASLQVRSEVLNDSGCALVRRYQLLRQLADLNGALTGWQNLLNELPVTSLNRAALLNNLILGLQDRYVCTQQLEDLDTAIEMLKEVLTLTSPPPERATWFSYLGHDLFIRYTEVGKLEDLDAAIQFHQEALTLSSPVSPQWANRLDRLAKAWRARYDHTKLLADLDIAIQAFQEITVLTSHDSPTLASRLGNLGLALRHRYLHTKQLGDLDEAIQIFQEILALIAEDAYGSYWFKMLGMALHERYAHRGQVSDLEEAIQAFQEALALAPSVSASLFTHLGLSLLDYYVWTKEVADLNAAIRAFKEALLLTPENSQKYIFLVNHLYVSLHARHLHHQGQVAVANLTT